MTYTEAAKNPANQKQQWLFRDPKKLSDGADERWCVLENGCIALLKGSNNKGVLVGIPVQSLKHDYRLVLQMITHKEWRASRARFRAMEV